MAKLLEIFTKDYAKIIEKRQLRRIGTIKQKADDLVTDICQWHKIDDEGDINISSKIAHNFDVSSDQHAQALTNYQVDIKNQLNDITVKVQKVISIENSRKIKNTRSDKIRASKRLISILTKLESHISKDVHRRLRNRRRKEMQNVCRLERLENKVKVHNFTTLDIDIDLVRLLEKGPNHIPKITIPESNRVSTCKDHLTNVLQQITYSTKNPYPKLTPLGLELNKTSLPTETINGTLVNIDIINDYLKDIPQPDGTEEKDKTLKKLYKLAQDDMHIVNCADKNLGFVINSTEWYNNELNRQLSDGSTYVKIENIQDNQQLIDISKNNLDSLLSRLERTKINVDQLTPLRDALASDLTLPSLNLQPKIHKLDSPPSPQNEHLLKGRPILNGFNFTTSSVSRLFNSYMEKIYYGLIDLYEINNITFPCLKNSDELIQKYKTIDNFSLSDICDIYQIVFDYESLYTNITETHTKQMFHFALKHDIIDIYEMHIMNILLRFLQDNIFFHIGHNKYYRQIRGLPMGAYHSMHTSNNVLLCHEFQLLQLPIMKQVALAYSRYIDDGKGIIKGDFLMVLNVIREISNHLPEGISVLFNVGKFKATYLDLCTTLDYNTFRNGRISFRIYQKEFNTYSYIHRTSNHSRHIFSGIIRTEAVRYRRKSSCWLERQYIQNLFTTRLVKQGYKQSECKFNYTQKQCTNHATYDDNTKHTRFVKVKYNSVHGLHLATRKVVSRYKNIRLLNTNNRKLREILITKRKMHDKIGKFSI